MVMNENILSYPEQEVRGVARWVEAYKRFSRLHVERMPEGLDPNKRRTATETYSCQCYLKIYLGSFDWLILIFLGMRNKTQVKSQCVQG